ncbi:MAG: beta-ketoacyl synthase chain length factor [Formosimonas sp.]
MTTPHTLRITQWAAWAPNLATQNDWRAWAQQPQSTSGDDMPDVSALPAMQRRRMNRMARMCYTVVQAIEGSADVPQIYCSRHGDLSRSTQLLHALAENEPLSSTSFGLSVHNAAGAATSILQGNRQAITSIAAGKDGVRHAFYEVLSHLAEHPSVVLVVYDEVVPDFYQIADTPVFAYALLIERGEGIALDFQAQDGSALPAELSVLAQVVQGQNILKLGARQDG